MPSRAASHEPQYPALTLAPQQVKFSHRRRSARPHKAASDGAKPRISLDRRQSTLTQLVDGGERDVDVVDLVSGSDEEYQEDRPKKRRKTASLGNEMKAPKKVKMKLEKTESQPTFFEALASVPAKKARRRRETGLDTQGWQIWQDPGNDADFSAASRLNHTRRRPRFREADGANPTDTPSRYDSAHDSRSAFATSPVIPESSQKSTLDLGSNEHSPQNPNIATPKTVRQLEVPSSQSPASGRWTDSKAQKFWESRRSPLGQRSPNVRRRVLDDKTQDLSALLLDGIFTTGAEDEQPAAEVVFTPVPKPGLRPEARCRPAAPTEALAQESASSELQTRPAMPPPPRPPKFARTTTIADSQSDDLSLVETQSLEAAYVVRHEQQQSEDTGAGQVEVEQSQQHLNQPRRLQRITTIQDSEYEDSDLEDQDYEPPHLAVAGVHEAAETVPRGAETIVQCDSAMDEGGEFGLEHNDSSDAGEATYDPAFSALDRDAARFALLTQNQRIKREVLPAQSLACNNELEQQAPDLETQAATADLDGQDAAAEQLSHGLSIAAQDEVDFVPSSQAHERRRTQQIMSAMDEGRVPATQPVQPVDVKGVEERVPSSPPPLRPSQVSTVAPSPTQRTPTRRSANAAQPIILTSPSKSIPDSIDDDWSPVRDFQASSSPMPLPPWTQPEDAFLGGQDTAGETLGSMSDFSLPPPPPLSSET